MKIETKTRKKFRKELIIFEDLLFNGEELCNNFQFLITHYSINNAFGTLHFHLARNLRLIKSSYELSISGNYTEAFIIIRSVMESSLLSRYFALNPNAIEEYHNYQIKIEQEQNIDIKKKLLGKLNNIYGPGAIRRKITGLNDKLDDDFYRVYNSLSSYVHPPILREGEFLQGSPNKQFITLKTSFHEEIFIEWFRAAALSLATSLKIFEILYQKGCFKHLGKPFLLKLKKMAEQIIYLIEVRANT